MDADRKKRWVALTAAGLLVFLVIGWAIWQIAGWMHTSWNQVITIDLPRAAPHPVRKPTQRSLPLASMPWKRLADNPTPVVVGVAVVPWNRLADNPTPVVVGVAVMPWNRRLTTPSPADKVADGSSSTGNGASVLSPSAESEALQRNDKPATAAQPMINIASPWIDRSVTATPVIIGMAEVPWRREMAIPQDATLDGAKLPWHLYLGR